jgi:hypothetical protein
LLLLIHFARAQGHAFEPGAGGSLYERHLRLPCSPYSWTSLAETEEMKLFASAQQDLNSSTSLERGGKRS